MNYLFNEYTQESKKTYLFGSALHSESPNDIDIMVDLTRSVKNYKKIFNRLNKLSGVNRVQINTYRSIDRNSEEHHFGLDIVLITKSDYLDEFMRINRCERIH